MFNELHTRWPFTVVVLLLLHIYSGSQLLGFYCCLDKVLEVETSDSESQ